MNNYQIYMRDVERHKTLTHKEEIQLFKVYQEGSRKAYREIYNANLKFVVKIAHKYKNQGVDLMDLIQAGNIGLDMAIKSFDLDKKVKLISHAIWRIRQQILEELARQSRFVKITGVEANKKSQMDKKTARLEQKLCRKATRKEISKSLNIPMDTLLHMELLNPQVSLNQKTNNNEGDALVDLLEDKKCLTPEQHLNGILEEKIINFLNTAKKEDKLTDEGQDIIQMYFGIGYGTEHTLEQIGEKYDYTREWIRKLRNKYVKMVKSFNKIKTVNKEFHLSPDMAEN